MTFKVKLDIPDPSEIGAGGQPEAHPDVRRAREAAAQVRREAAAADATLATATARVKALTADVPAGRAPLAELEDALVKQRAAALTPPGYQARIREADAAAADVLARVRRGLLDAALRRRDDLQEQADKLRPALEALRDAEAALDALVFPLGARGGVPPLTWPQTLDDEGYAVSARQMAAAARPAASAPAPVPVGPQEARATTRPTFDSSPVEPRSGGTSVPRTDRPAARMDAPVERGAPALAHPAARGAETAVSSERRLMLPPLDRRAAVSGTDADKRTARLVWSTGADVERVEWQTGRKYLERLSLDPKHVRLERLNSGAPLLNAHSSDSLSDVIGTVEPNSVELRPHEALATVRFSKRADVEPIFQDVRDKIVRNVSVGYRVHRFEEQAASQGNPLPIWTATDWEPYEISMVPMGADAGARVRTPAAQAYTNPCVLEVSSAPAGD